jgi:hypothetical protein
LPPAIDSIALRSANRTRCRSASARKRQNPATRGRVWIRGMGRRAMPPPTSKSLQHTPRRAPFSRD